MFPSGAEYPGGLQLRRVAWSDDRGRHTFTGLVVGAYCEILTFEGGEKPARDGIFTRGFKVDSPVPISLPSLIVPTPSAQAADAAAEHGGYRDLPVKLAAMARPTTIPAGPSRAEIEDLIRVIGRDPAATRLVDRIVARFHPRLWTGDFNYVRRLATEPVFFQRMDGLARAALGKPLDTIMLLRCVTTYQVGYDDAIMKSLLQRWLADDRAPRTPIRGAIVDQRTNLPVRGARVSTDLHDFTDEGFVRTDDDGRFRLSASPRSTWYVGFMELRNDLKHVAVWTEADGYASALRFVPLGAHQGRRS